MPSHQVNEKSAGEKKNLGLGNRGQRGSRIVLSLAQVPSLFSQQNKGVEHNELEGLIHT